MKIGIALSGGGIRGVAHAGVLKALEDNQIEIDIIGGTSAGSMVASLYAMGYRPHTIYKLFKKYSKEIINANASWFSKIFQKNASITGIRKGEEIEQIYNKLAKQKKIQEYVFTNYIPKETPDKTQYITNVAIGKAVRASSSFPAVFSPCYMEKCAFMDGGVLDNVPVYEVRKQGADKVLAVKFDADPIDENSNVMDIVMKTIDIMGSKISKENLENSDYVLSVYTDKVGLLDVEKLDKCYEYGYQSVIDNLEEIKRIFVK